MHRYLIIEKQALCAHDMAVVAYLDTICVCIHMPRVMAIISEHGAQQQKPTQNPCLALAWEINTLDTQQCYDLYTWRMENVLTAVPL